MKTRYILMIFAASMLVCQSCSDFLKEKNPVGRQNIYMTESDLEAAVEGVLSGFSYGNGITGESNEAFPIASGLVHWGKSESRLNSNKWKSALKFVQYASNDWNGRYFRSLYTPIFRANALIAGLQTSPVDEEYKLEIEAEARLYRAVAYFHAVRIWGDIPLRLEEVSVENASAKARSPYYDVYVQIIRDLEFAEKFMRTPYRVKEVPTGIVRPDKFAATAYLSSVYVTIGSLLASHSDNFWDASKEGRAPDFSALQAFEELAFPLQTESDYKTAASIAYSEALKYAEYLIPESGKADVDCQYRLLTKFGDLFEYDDNFSRDGYTSWEHPEQVLVFPVTVNGDTKCGHAQYQLPQYPEGTSTTVKNEQWGRVRPTRWVFQQWCGTYPGEWRNSSKTEYISSSDPRLDVTFFYNRMEYCLGQVFWESTGIDIYPKTISRSNTSAFPYFKKYASPRYNVTTGDSDVYMMRFAEIYLNAVEAAAYLDNQSLARKYMDVLHARARHSVPDGQEDSTQPTWADKTFSSKDELMTSIFWERIYEFYGESKEYYETHRHGAGWLLENIIKPKNKFLALSNQAHLRGYYYPDDPSEDQPWQYSEDPLDARKGLLSGFPVEEVLYNSGIENNGRNDFDFGL